MKPIGNQSGAPPATGKLVVGSDGQVYQPYRNASHHIGDSKWPSVVPKPRRIVDPTTTCKSTAAGQGFRHAF